MHDRAATSRDLLLLAVAATLLFTLWLGARDLWHPNEPTYGRAVAEMANSGTWSVPTVNGRPFVEKPILYYWLALLAAALFGGVDELTLRLPSAAAGVAMVVMLYALAWPYVGRAQARLAATLLATTFIVFWSARAVQMDLLLAACSLGAMLAASRVVDHGLDPRRGGALCGVAIGLGLLAKGPVGLICPGLPLLVYLAFDGRRRAPALRMLLPAAAVAALVAVPWYALLAARGGSDLLTEVLYRQNVRRFIEPWDHAEPWWYYLEYFWIDMAPWSFFVPLAWRLAPPGGAAARLERLSWIWIATLVAFFSLSGSKRSPYILPVAPAVAVLVSSVMRHWWAATLPRARLWAAWAVVGFLGVALAGAGAFLATTAHASDPLLGNAARLATLALIAGGLAVVCGLLLPWRRRFASVLVLLAFVPVLYLLASARVLPAANALKSHRGLCEAIVTHVGPDQQLRGYRLWDWRASYSYYSRRSVPNLDSLDELRAYWRQTERVFVVVERSRLEEARQVIHDAEPLVARGVGHNFAYLFANVQLTGDE